MGKEISSIDIFERMSVAYSDFGRDEVRMLMRNLHISFETFFKNSPITDEEFETFCKMRDRLGEGESLTLDEVVAFGIKAEKILNSKNIS